MRKVPYALSVTLPLIRQGIKMADRRNQKTDVNVNLIMSKVRYNIEKRKDPGLSEGDPSLITNNPDSLLDRCDIANTSYAITSHRKIIGPLLVRGRAIVNGEVKRYVDPALLKQIAFNENVSNYLDALDSRVTDVEGSNLDARLAAIERENGELLKHIKALDIADISGRVSRVEKMAEEGKSTSWSVFYDRDIGESDLQSIITYHREFVTQIEEYASKSAKDKVPKLLEIGLGTASFSIYFSRLSYYNIGIDNDHDIIGRSIETNRKLGGFARFIMMDAFDLDMFKDKYFDLAFSQGTMEHFDNKSAIELLSKQLKVARYVVFSVPSINYEYREYGNERKMRTEDWERLLTGAGFKIEYLGYYQDNKQISCIISDMRE